MKAIRGYPVRVIGTGFIVLVLLSLPLFCLRWYCTFVLAVRMPDETRHVYIRPSGVLPEEIEMDPNVVAGSSVSGYMQPRRPLVLGMVNYLVTKEPKQNRSNILFYDEKKGDFLYFDEKRGLLVHRNTYEMRMIPDNELVRRKVQLYAGPEGVSESPDKGLGQFVEPVLCRRYDRSKTFLYDGRQRRFFAIDFDERIVTKGPELGKDDPREPIQIGELLKNWPLLYLDWSYPMALKLSKEEEDALRKEYTLMIEDFERKKKEGILPSYWGPRFGPPDSGTKSYTGYWDLKNSFRGREKVPRVTEYWPRGGDEYILVLDKSGRIELLDSCLIARSARIYPARECIHLPPEANTPLLLEPFLVREKSFLSPNSQCSSWSRSLVDRNVVPSNLVKYPPFSFFQNLLSSVYIPSSKHLPLPCLTLRPSDTTSPDITTASFSVARLSVLARAGRPYQAQGPLSQFFHQNQWRKIAAASRHTERSCSCRISCIRPALRIARDLCPDFPRPLPAPRKAEPSVVLIHYQVSSSFRKYCGGLTTLFSHRNKENLLSSHHKTRCSTDFASALW